MAKIWLSRCCNNWSSQEQGPDDYTLKAVKAAAEGLFTTRSLSIVACREASGQRQLSSPCMVVRAC
jgi:hypothetical protein